MNKFGFFIKFLLLLVMFFAADLAYSQPISGEEGKIGASGLPLPRFVSLSAGEANLRSGPGEQYPINWVYKRKLYPLEIIGEYDQWRQVRDVDGTEGWMHRVLLSGNRTVLVVGENVSLLQEPSALGPLVARIEAGVLGEILKCSPGWCRLDIDGTRGWAATKNLWGTYQGEIIN